MKVRIERLNADSVVPKYANIGDAGLDLVATSRTDGTNKITYGTGIAIEIPEGYVGLIYPRSSICNTDLALSNSVGVIDSGYRGEIKFVFNVLTAYGNKIYEVGDRIGQLIIIPYPQIEFEEVDSLSTTERGDGGYGSTGK